MEKVDFSHLGFMNNEQEFLKQKKLTRQALDDNYLFDQWLKQQDIDSSQLEDIIDNHIFKISNWLNTIHYCNSCQGLANCQFASKGLRPWLDYNGAYIEDSFQYCDYKLKYDHEYGFLDNIMINDYAIKYKDTQLKDLNNIVSQQGDNKVLLSDIAIFLKSNTINQKGFYIYGPVGTGKTYTTIVLCNELAKKGYKVCFLNVASWISRCKNSLKMKENNIEDDIYKLSHSDLIVLDDIGAENNSAWTRDDLLFPILDYRMNHDKLTLFTSNMDWDRLQEHFAYNNTSKDYDNESGYRIMERIKKLSKPYHLGGKNLR